MAARDGGIGRLMRRLAAIPDEVKARSHVATIEAAEELVDLMKKFAPEKTGALRDSIAVTPGGQATPAHSQPGGTHLVPEGAVAVTAGNNGVRYAHLVEWGSEGNEAQPFFFPAVRMSRKAMRSKINRAIKKAIKESAQ